MADRLFNVVIEQPRSPAPGAAAALAAAISARYGIPAGDLERRIARGRFRVKSKVDRATADTYAADLTRLGAVCIIQPVEDASTSVVAAMPSVSAQMPAVSAPPDLDGMALPQGNRDPAPRPLSERSARIAAEAVRPPERTQAPTPAPPTGAAAKWPAEAPRTEISPPSKWPGEAPRTEISAPGRWPEEAPRTELSPAAARAPEPITERGGRIPAEAVRPAPEARRTLEPTTDRSPRMPVEAARPATEPRRAPEPATDRSARVPADAVRAPEPRRAAEPSTDRSARVPAPAEPMRPATDTSWQRASREAAAPGTDPARPRVTAQVIQAAQPAPGTDPARPRVPAQAAQPAPAPGTDPARPRVPAQAAQPAPALAPAPGTDPARPRVPAQAAQPAPAPGTDPARPRVPAQAAQPAPAPGTDPARPRVPAPAAEPAPAPRPAAQPLPLAPPPASAPALDLGALSGGMPLTLSTLDGASPERGAAARVAAQSNNLPASFGPPSAPEPAPAPAPAPARPRTEPSTPSPSSAAVGRAAPAEQPGPDLFAPPAAAVELEVTLDTEAPRRRDLAAATASRTTAAPRPGVPEVPWPAATLPPRVSDTRTGASGASTAFAPTAGPTGGLRNPYVRLVAGAALAVGLGFLPAHFVAAAREHAAYAELDLELTKREATIRSRADYDAFDAVRAAYADRKRAARTSIAYGSIALWILVGGGVGWLWFRRIVPPTVA